MPSATTTQLRRLDETIAGFTSEQWQFSGNQAVLYVEVSPESGVWLFLRPEGEKSGKEVWAGELVREWANEPESRTEGTYDDCVTWLRNRRKELKAQHQAISDIRDFIDGRKGWRFHDSQTGKVYVGRLFDYHTHGQVMLSVQVLFPHLRHAPLTGQINLQFSTGPEESITGKLGEVGDWVSRWEKVLQVPLLLAESATLRQARSLVEQTDNRTLSQLAYLLDIEAQASRIRVALIEMFVPAAVRNRYPS